MKTLVAIVEDGVGDYHTRELLYYDSKGHNAFIYGHGGPKSHYGVWENERWQRSHRTIMFWSLGAARNWLDSCEGSSCISYHLKNWWDVLKD